MYEIPNFSNYFLDEDNNVVRKANDTIVTKQARGSGVFKMKNDSGLWKEVSYSKILSLVFTVDVPEAFVEVSKYPNIYVNKNGTVWGGPTTNNPLGVFYTENRQKDDYPRISTNQYGKLYIHILLSLAFLDPEYLDKGLCVMHLDDNKTNYSLTNLKVSTYSENNKAAYETGVNPSKKQ